jgi:hypothetical protein
VGGRRRRRLGGGALKSPPATPRQISERPLRWLETADRRRPLARVRYTGRLVRDARRLVLHYGYDGWAPPVRDVPLERADDESWLAEIDTDDHYVIDCVVRDDGSDRCDSNDGADYRLWVDLEPIDAHLHAQDASSGRLGVRSLSTAISSAGMVHGLVSWGDNDFVDLVCAAVAWLTPLVWVSPSGPSVEQVGMRLAEGAAGLKLHPAHDHYPANSSLLDPYLRVAEEMRVPVTVHSGPGVADPDLIRQLAERFPRVRFLLYHTFLGPLEGRRRASRHAQELANLYLETSWCASPTVERLIDEVGPGRVLFGSDAAVDGPEHFVRQPPNLELTENYNDSLLRLARRLPADVFRQLVEDNARALFALGVRPDARGELR